MRGGCLPTFFEWLLQEGWWVGSDNMMEKPIEVHLAQHS